jgi:flagellar biosynthesis protein FlhF
MKVKRLYFNDIKEGIEEIKKRFGPETFILDIRNGTGEQRKGWEISIGVEEQFDSNGEESGLLRRKMEETWRRFFQFLKERMEEIESELVSEKMRDYPLTLRIFLDRMVSNGLEKGLALSLISEVFWDIGMLAEESLKANYFLRHVIGKRIRILELTSDETTLLVVGPSGSGKTETVKKIASLLSDEREDVSIVACDPQNRGTYDELMAFSKEKRIPLSFTTNEEELHAIVSSNGRKRKLIDIAGTVEIQKRIVSSLKGTKRVAVFAAGTRYESLRAYLEEVGERDIHGLVFTKLDEEPTLGHLVTYIMKTHLPVALFTKGPEIRDILMPTEDVLWKMIFERNPWKKKVEP